MAVQQYNLINGDWLGLGVIINDLATRVIGQIVAPGSSPEFAGLTIGALSGILKASAGLVSGSANHGDLNDMPSSSNTNHDLRYPTRAEWLQNGFPNRTDSSISFNDGTRRFTINPSGASFDYFIAGVKYTVSSSDVLNVNYVYLGDTPAEGPWYIYYDGSTLIAVVSPNHAAIRDVYENKAMVAIVFWDADNSKGQLLEDRHGLSMSPLTHVLIHQTVGTRFDTGLALNTITTDQDGSADSHAQFGVDAGEIFDEDIEHTLNAISSITGLQIWYRDASGWTFTTNANFSMVTTGTGRLAYDNNGTLTEVTNNYYVLCHVFATSMSHLNPVVAIGQSQYSTKKLAQQGALTEIINILAIADISPELKPIASVIFHTNNNHSNSVKARIVSTDEGDDYVDFRTDALNPAFSSAQNHGNLAGLANDDHTQYLLADGTRVLAGAWNMGNQALTNVNIDGGVITGITDLAIADGGTGASNAADARTNLGLVIGTNIQAYDAGLQNLASIAMTADKFYYTSANNIHVAADVTAFARSILDDVDEATFKTTVNLEIGTDVLAQQTIGIADNNLVETDDADAADNDYAKFTANGLEGRNYAEVLSDLSAQMSSAFDLNGQDLANGGVIFLTEQAAAETDVAGKGQIWVKTATPNEAYFTDDAGTDFLLNNGYVRRGDLTKWDFALKKQTGSATSTLANHLVDTAATFQTNNIAVGDYVHNTTDNTWAKITVVNSETDLTLDTDIMVNTEVYYAGSWRTDGIICTLDLSSIIPVGAKAFTCIISVNDDDTASWVRMSPNEYTGWENRIVFRTQTANVDFDGGYAVECGASRIFKYSTIGRFFVGIYFSITGWWI